MIRENILANIVTTLQAVNGTGGYNYKLNHVERARLTKFDGIYPAAFVFEETDAPVEEYDSTIVRKLTVTVEAWIESTSSISQGINKLLADIEKAMMTDRTRGGHAIDTNPPTAQFVVMDGMPAGVLVSFDITYHHAAAQP